MNKQGVTFGIVGLILGLIIGFMGANSVNRSASGQAATSSGNTATAGTSDSTLPADHPPIGTSSGAQSMPGAMQPQVAQAIERARQQPNDYDAQMTAADLYYQIQRFDDASKFYEAAAKLKPGEVEPIVKAGNAYFDGETYEEAEKWYVRALAKRPNDVNVRTDLGLTYFLREPRNIDRAIKEYKASLVIDPNHEITLQNLALAYREQNDTANYNVTLEKLRSINPNNPLFKSGSPGT